MTQRTALILAAALTAFVLVLIGAVAVHAAQAQAALAAVPAVPATVDPSVRALIQERDAAYQKLIQQANDQLQQAYQQEQALSQQLAQAQAQIQQLQNSSSPYAVSPEVAGWIGLDIAPGARLMRTPELVNFQGMTVYEVVLDAGTVYVDANSGRVVFARAARSRDGGEGQGDND